MRNAKDADIVQRGLEGMLLAQLRIANCANSIRPVPVDPLIVKGRSSVQKNAIVVLDVVVVVACKCQEFCCR